MNMEFERKIAIPMEVKEMFPIDAEVQGIVEKKREEIKKIISGRDDRILLVIGPCSADREDAVLDYILRLKKVQEKVEDKVFIVPRVYTNKPRTTGSGYKGMVHQPNPEKGVDFVAGLIAMRHMHIRAVEETGLTPADEMLYPENWRYVSDILSYVAIGARSVEDQQHRLTVSGFDVPAGMKNPTSGDLAVMMNSIYAAQHAHSFIYRGWEVKTTGNEQAHAVLNGIHHYRKISAGRILHACGYIKSGNGKSVLLVLNRTCTDRHI